MVEAQALARAWVWEGSGRGRASICFSRDETGRPHAKPRNPRHFTGPRKISKAECAQTAHHHSDVRAGAQVSQAQRGRSPW